MLSWHSVFCATVLYFICWAECQRTACLIILRLSLRALWLLFWSRCWKLCAFHCINHPPSPIVAAVPRRQPHSSLTLLIHSVDSCYSSFGPSLPWQCMLYADRATDGLAPCFWIMLLSWLYRSRLIASGPGEVLQQLQVAQVNNR